MKKQAERKKNPFRPSFGSIPIAMAGRNDIIEDILEGLDNDPGDPNRACIFVGARGTGKTVMMAHIAEMAQQRGWISIDVTSGETLLEEIIVQIREKAEHILASETVRRISGIQIAGTSISFSLSEQKSTWRSEFTKLVAEINAAGCGLLITVDEISVRDEGLKKLIETFQHMVRERRNVAVMMAGLPANVTSLLTDEKVSFVRRAFRYDLGAISTREVAYAIKQTVERGGRTIGDDALWLAAEETEGFAFLIQLIGYHMWRQSPGQNAITKEDAVSAAEFARRDMESAVFEDTLNELTEREMDFLFAMTFGEKTATIEIADRIGISLNNVTHIKRRLVERGVVLPAGRGKVKFAHKAMGEYIASL